MWRTSPHELPVPSRRAAAFLQCTAEHLIARCDGGTDVASNVVAACWRCNRTRHARRWPPSADTYRAEVRRRVARGGWHDRWVSAAELYDCRPCVPTGEPVA
ncbi:HNH endonuclease [Roseateles agri]|uniref:HNH endonuclease n=1 Tax=Roseateles agri TaxID=3098619 RepID=UPI003D6787EB